MYISDDNKYALSDESKRILSAGKILDLLNRAVTEDEIIQAKAAHKKWKSGFGILSIPLRIASVLLIPLFMSCMIYLGLSFSDVLDPDTSVAFQSFYNIYDVSKNYIIYFAGLFLSFYGLGLEGIGATGSFKLVSLSELSVLLLGIIGLFVTSLWLIERSVADILKRGTHYLSSEDVALFKNNFAQALLGEKSALRYLAESFDQDGIVLEDKAVAVTFYSLAAEAGDHSSGLIVAHRYKQGAGIPCDMDMYLQWLKFAAELGSYEATKELAELQSPSSTSSCLPCIVAGVALGIIIS
jgi:hypothetical protein